MTKIQLLKRPKNHLDTSALLHIQKRVFGGRDGGRGGRTNRTKVLENKVYNDFSPTLLL